MKPSKGKIDYETGALEIEFDSPPAKGEQIVASYSWPPEDAVTRLGNLAREGEEKKQVKFKFTWKSTGTFPNDVTVDVSTIIEATNEFMPDDAVTQLGDLTRTSEEVLERKKRELIPSIIRLSNEVWKATRG